MASVPARMFASLLVLVGLGGCSHASFYRYTTQEAAGASGSLLRYQDMADPPNDASAYRILYRSVGLQNEPIAVSGMAFVPRTPIPAGGRPVVAWAHPTSGIVPKCAPSLSELAFVEIAGLRELLRRGFVVVATDYPGLGTAGPHPYLIGDSEGRAVLDSVRAARALPDAHTSNRFAVWGHSQGGQAALFTASLAASYAPELQLVGVATAAPATDLESLLRDDFSSAAGRNITAMTLWSWTRVYGIPLDHLDAVDAQPAMNALANECLESPLDFLERRVSQRGLEKQFLMVRDVTQVEPWREILLRNIASPPPAQLPLFIAQDDADTVVRLDVTAKFANQACAHGNAVRYLTVPGAGHGFVASDAATAVASWIEDRFAGRAPPNDCAAIALRTTEISQVGAAK